MMYSECCGEIVYDDYDLCSECLEHCDVYEDDDDEDHFLHARNRLMEELLEMNPEFKPENKLK